MSVVNQIANNVGVTEPAIKLILTVLAGYIFALVQRIIFPFNSLRTLKLLYFIGIGLCLLYWNYGLDLYHSALCIIFQYLVFLVFGGSLFSVLISFAFQLGYLIHGYLYYSTIHYDINWCMPHCILTLRLIGLAFDVYDGHKDEKLLTKDQKETYIKDYPSLLEIFGFSYLYCGFLVGPQFPLQRFRDMLDGKLTDNPGSYPNSILPGLRRGLEGIVALLCQTYLSTYFYVEYYTTLQYQQSSFLYKLGYLSITGYVCFLQYMAVWMINEGVGIFCGLNYKKDEKTGKVDWNDLRNVVFHKVLLAESFQDIIDSFNINTNKWVLRYVYKRLRFIGIREVSQSAALFFLAIWHGIHEGYFLTFFYEFLTMNVERAMFSKLDALTLVKKIKTDPSLNWIPRVAGFLYVHLLFGYCLIAFNLHKWDLFHPVFLSIYYYGHILNGTLLIFFKLFPDSRSSHPKTKQ